MLALQFRRGRVARQVFVTHSRTSARRAMSHFTKLRQAETNDINTSIEEMGTVLSLQDMDESAESGWSLPARFSQLSDHDFPLFLSFDQVSIYITSTSSTTQLTFPLPQFCALLAADYNLSFEPLSSPTSECAFPRASLGAARGPLVSSQYFASVLWPRFDIDVKEGLGENSREFDFASTRILKHQS